ncbi:hypothetical protein MMYC01_208582 [Madurella mycetomatis]|uniref:Uncharacterized protein n=1 Tax=Madurella mycetomatis TaxID=100816 RepID=A0A175W1A6_9PEZI|nr:hypothetical protein MMYC01_208582 [Madurella mycetomatis]
MRVYINHVSKLEFLCSFREAFFASITERNIQGGLAGAGLVPHDPERVLSRLDIKLRIPTPPTSRPGTAQSWAFQTPHNPREADSQSTLIKTRIANYQTWTLKSQPANVRLKRASSPIARPTSQVQPSRPASRDGFEIAIICALPLEAEAVEALFDHWDDDDDNPPYDKAAGNPNAYSTGVIGRHNVVLAYMPNMGKVAADPAASYCRMSFRRIRLAVVVGICGAVPFSPNNG